MKLTRRSLLKALGVAPAVGLVPTESSWAKEIELPPCPREQELLLQGEVLIGHLYALDDRAPKQRVNIFVETAYMTIVSECFECGESHNMLMEPSRFEMNEWLYPWKTPDGSRIVEFKPCITFVFYEKHCRILINGARRFEQDPAKRYPGWHHGSFLHTDFYI